MKFRLYEKFFFQDIGNILIEIKGFDGFNQRTRKDMNQEDQYIIKLNGFKIKVPESFLNYLEDTFKKTDYKDEQTRLKKISDDFKDNTPDE